MIKRRQLGKVKIILPKYLARYENYPTITNYVVTVNLGVDFRIDTIVLYLSNADRKPTKFAALTFRIHPTTCLLFRSGIMVITGAKTLEGAKLAAHIYRLFLEKVPQPVIYVDSEGRDVAVGLEPLEKYTKFDDFNVRNMVGSGPLLNDAINLGSLKKESMEYSGWQPEIFPGLRYTITKGPDVPLKKRDSCMSHIFDTGNGVVMGVKDKKDLYIAYNFLRKLVNSYTDSKAPTEKRDKFLYRVLSVMEGADGVSAANKKNKSATKNAEQMNEEEILQTLAEEDDQMFLLTFGLSKLGTNKEEPKKEDSVFIELDW